MPTPADIKWTIEGVIDTAIGERTMLVILTDGHITKHVEIKNATSADISKMLPGLWNRGSEIDGAAYRAARQRSNRGHIDALLDAMDQTISNQPAPRPDDLYQAWSSMPESKLAELQKIVQMVQEADETDLRRIVAILLSLVLANR